MKVIHLNEEAYYYPDDMFKDADLMVTDYETQPYEGSGDALVLRKNKVEYYYLGHCSCYGPFENGSAEIVSLEEFKNQNSEVTNRWSDKLAKIFLEEIEKLSVISYSI